MTDADRLDRIESQLALHRLAHEYCHGADKRDRERFAAVWTDDAVWVVSPDMQFVGIEEICAAVADQWAAFRQMHHWTANHVVDIVGDRASGEADVDVTVEFADGSWLRGGGTLPRRLRARRWALADRAARGGLQLRSGPAAARRGPPHADERPGREPAVAAGEPRSVNQPP